MRTSVLSKSWEYRWNYIFNVNISDRAHFSNDTSDRDHEAHFSNFMNVLFANSHNFKSFDLWCYRKYDASLMRTWISTVFRRNVETVNICVRGSYAPDHIILSRSLLNCTSLRSLRLNMCCTLKVLVNNCFQNLTSLELHNVTLKVLVNNCFQNLTSLHLHKVIILNDNSHTDTLTFNFPLLETLNLYNCKWLNVRFVELCAPALSSFVSWTTVDTEDDNCIFKIIGAMVDEFYTSAAYPGNFLLVRSAVVSAAVYSFGKGERLGKAGLQIRRLLKEFSSLEELNLSCFAVQAIAQTKSGLPLPKYDKLVRLAVIYTGSYADHDPGIVEALFELLHAAPFLNVLDIDTSSFFFNVGEYDYGAVESVPDCIFSHLEEVILKNFTYTAAELELAAFLLQNGAKLKKFTISRARPCRKGKDELAQELAEFPKASASVKIVVT